MHTHQGIATVGGMCSLSRYIVVGGVVGVAASSLAGSDLAGLLAAALAVLVLLATERLVPSHLGRGSCARPVPDVQDPTAALERADAEPR